MKIDNCLVTPLDTSAEYIDNNSTDSNTSSVNDTEPVLKAKLTNCPVTMSLEAEMFPSPKSKMKLSCGHESECHLKVQSPILHKWTYILLDIDNNFNVSEIQFQLHFEKKGKYLCVLYLIIALFLRAFTIDTYVKPSKISIL